MKIDWLIFTLVLSLAAVSGITSYEADKIKGIFHIWLLVVSCATGVGALVLTSLLFKD